jgi:cell wall assembly regulator SMI1
MGKRKRRFEAVMQELLNRLESWLRQNAPSCFRCLLPGVTKQDLKAFEDALTFALPDALQLLYLWRNGQSQGSRPLFGDAHTRYTFLTLREVQEAHANLNYILEELEEEGLSGWDTWWHPTWIPFLDAGGNHLCVDTKGTLGGVPGQVISFFHDDSSRVIDYPSLEQWLETFVVSLETQLWRERDGSLELLDQDQFEQLVKRMNPGYPIVVHSQV